MNQASGSRVHTLPACPLLVGLSHTGAWHIIGDFSSPPPPLPVPGFGFRSSLEVSGLFCPVPRRNVHSGLGPGPRRKAALWAKGEPLGGRGHVYPGPGVWLGVAPLSAAPAAPGLCWAPDVRWLQPAGPPPRAQRGFIKSGCGRPRRPPGSSLLLARSPGPACRSQASAAREARSSSACSGLCQEKPRPGGQGRTVLGLYPQERVQSWGAV